MKYSQKNKSSSEMFNDFPKVKQRVQSLNPVSTLPHLINVIAGNCRLRSCSFSAFLF